MNYKIVFLLSFITLHFLCWSQSFEWEGYGKGLSYLKIKDGHVGYNGYRDADGSGGRLKAVDDHWITYYNKDPNSTDTLFRRIQVLNSSFDSLRIDCYHTPVTYYKTKYLDYVGRYKFKEMRLEYLDSDFDLSIEFNYYGYIRLADNENKTLFEGTVEKSKVDQFKELIKYIDIRNLNISIGWQTVCNDREFMFIFKDLYNEIYTYRAVRVPIQLVPVKEFLEELLKANGYPVIWPHGRE